MENLYIEPYTFPTGIDMDPIMDPSEVLSYELNGFTQEQKDWIDRRDGCRCQFIDEYGNQCIADRKHGARIERHHIVPQHTFKSKERRYGMIDHPDKNAPTNALTLCQRHHGMVHPSVRKAKDAYRRMMEAGLSRFDANKIFSDFMSLDAAHDDRWDDLFLHIANYKTYEYLRNHPEDPFPLGNGYTGGQMIPFKKVS